MPYLDGGQTEACRITPLPIPIPIGDRLLASRSSLMKSPGYVHEMNTADQLSSYRGRPVKEGGRRGCPVPP